MARVAQGVAAAVVAATFVDDALQASVLSHRRSPFVYAGAMLLAVALLALAPRTGSTAVSLGAGLAGGGALATLACGLAWRRGVPNPLVLGDVAFNVADVAIELGVCLLVGGALWHAWAHRDELREPV